MNKTGRWTSQTFVIPSIQQCGVWLGINLVTVYLITWLIGQLQTTLDQLVALAISMSIVFSIGSIAGSKTLIIVCLVLNQIFSGNLGWLSMKRLGVDAFNGVAWSAVVAIVTYLWFQNLGLSLVIAATFNLHLLATAQPGGVALETFKRFGFVPALSETYLLTTVADFVGFFCLLGLATWFFL